MYDYHDAQTMPAENENIYVVEIAYDRIIIGIIIAVIVAHIFQISKPRANMACERARLQPTHTYHSHIHIQYIIHTTGINVKICSRI